MTAVHQFLPVFGAHDAIGNHTLRVRDILREAGYDSEIFVADAHPGVRRHCRHYSKFAPPVSRPSPWLLYHLSTGHEMATWIAERSEPLAVDYHNITPAAYAERWLPEGAEVARAARAEMRKLASTTRFALADSSYNAGELEAEGYADTAVAPILVDFSEYDAAPDAAAVARLRRAAEGGGAHWLFVGRISAQKCQHDVIGAFAMYRRVFDPKARLTLVGGCPMPLYLRALHLLVADLGVEGAVEFTDVLSFSQLLACYATADVFVSLSEHEGFCVPLVEAMHFGVPVVALASAAVPETVADAGLLLSDKDPLEVACAVDRVLTDAPLREAQVVAGRRRVEHFSLENNRVRLLSGLEAGIAAHS